jgi:hypothetical protein
MLGKVIENKLNNRPRKRYMFENPIFVMEKLVEKSARKSKMYPTFVLK